MRLQRACYFLWCVLAVAVLDEPASTAPDNSVDRYNVVWDSPSKDAGGSMPIGNGDIGLNVWAEKDGDLLFYIAKADACSENSEFLKLGRVRVKLRPNPLAAGNSFRQELRLRQGEIAISGGPGERALHLRVWVDAHRPVIEVEAAAAHPFDLQATLELWRTARRTIDPQSKEMFGLYELRGGPEPVVIAPDTVLPARGNRLVWYHRNERSTYPSVLRVQHLEALLDKYPDPLLHRTFGACMQGSGLVAADDHTLKSAKPATKYRLSITALTAQATTPEAWEKKLNEVAAAAAAVDLESARQAHESWWQAFWDRSWLHVTGSKQAEAVSSGYALQRWMMACSSRGSLPVKFNGGLFTVGATFTDPNDKTVKIHDPDYRAWGSNYWFQNNRHLYWPLIVTGDDDLLAPWFKMYMDALPLARDKTKDYYHHDGACFQETIYFWGTTNNSNFGWQNKNVETTNGYIRRYWSGGIEMTAMMLDRFACTLDRSFARDTLIPFADAITTFYDQHWKRDEHGKIRFDPAQSLETWHVAVNPLPEIAGLRYVLPRLLALPVALTTEAQRALWKKTLADLPPIPIGPGPDGKPILLPAQVFKNKSNVENTELYAVYPYRLYGVGLPDLELARDLPGAPLQGPHLLVARPDGCGPARAARGCQGRCDRQLHRIRGALSGLLAAGPRLDPRPGQRRGGHAGRCSGCCCNATAGGCSSYPPGPAAGTPTSSCTRPIRRLSKAASVGASSWT